MKMIKYIAVGLILLMVMFVRLPDVHSQSTYWYVQEDDTYDSSLAGPLTYCRRSDTATALSADGETMPVLCNEDGKIWTTATGGGSNTEYTEGDTDATITGIAAMWEDTGDTLRAVSAAKPLPVDGSGVTQPVSVAVPLDVNTELNNPGTLDTFGRIVTSQPNNQVDVQFFRDDPENLVTVSTANNGTATKVGGSAEFATTSDASGEAKGVSVVSTSYRSGAEIYMLLTARFTTPTAADSFQRIGLYDDDNGFFIGFEGTSFGVTARNGTSDTTVAKSSFSEDDLTGDAGSLFTRAGSPEAVNFERFNVYRIRYGWLGSAPIVFEILAPDGRWVVFHIIKQPNLAIVASIENSDLPITVHVSKSTSDGTNLIIATSCWAAGVTTDRRALSATLTDDTLTGVNRVVIVAKKPNGDYVNVRATAGGNFEVAIGEFETSLPSGTNNIGDVDLLTGLLHANSPITLIDTFSLFDGSGETQIATTNLGASKAYSVPGTGRLVKLCTIISLGTPFAEDFSVIFFDTDPSITIEDASLTLVQAQNTQAIISFSGSDARDNFATVKINCQFIDESYSSITHVVFASEGATTYDNENIEIRLWYKRES